MSVTVTVTAVTPPQVELTFEHQPTEDDIREALEAKAQEVDFEGYVAEYIVTEGGGWTINPQRTDDAFVDQFTVLEIPLDKFTDSGPDEDTAARKNTSVMLKIQTSRGWTAIPLHMELLAVHDSPEDMQAADVYPENLDGLLQIYEAVYQTVQLDGREFVAYATPYGA